MTFDPANRMSPEEDPASIRLRDERLRTMGVTDQPYPELDAIADRLREITGASYAMVNFVIDGRQYFAGLSTPSGPQVISRDCICPIFSFTGLTSYSGLPYRSRFVAKEEVSSSMAWWMPSATAVRLGRP
jgi:hypothetical protein